MDVIKELNNKNVDYVMGLDVETYNGFQYPIIYDVGYAILDTNTMQLVKRVSLLIEDTYQLDFFSDGVYYSAKDERYEELISNDKITFSRYEDFLVDLRKDMEEYNIMGIYAYNYKHERKAFQATTALLLPEFMGWVGGICWYDALDFVGKVTTSRKYGLWCEKHEKITQSRLFYSTTLESVYQYIFNDLNFKESHTGYDDAYRMLQVMYQVYVEYDLTWYGDYSTTRFISRNMNYKTKILILPDGTRKMIKYHEMVVTDDTIELRLKE